MTDTSNPRRSAREVLREVEVEGLGRDAFLLRAVLAAGAALGAAAVPGVVGSALAQGGATVEGGPASPYDIRILGFALNLERMQADFYERALRGVRMSGETRALAEQIAEQERQHVEKLVSSLELLGGKATRPPSFRFPLGGEGAFLALAQNLEETAVGAYNGAMPAMRSTNVVDVAAGIAQVEARHAAGLRLRLGRPPSPPFSPALTTEQARQRTAQFTARR